MAAAEEREESKHVEQEGDHRTEILSGSDLTDQRLGPERGFGEGQGGIGHNLSQEAPQAFAQAVVDVDAFDLRVPPPRREPPASAARRKTREVYVVVPALLSFGTE